MRLGAKSQGDQSCRLNEIVIIGHMGGGSLAVSYEKDQKGLLLDIGNKLPPGDKFIYLHYQTTTEPGNSGSPLIDFESGKIIGLHRAGPGPGQADIPSLNNNPLRIKANEGVHIDSIRREIAAAVASGRLIAKNPPSVSAAVALAATAGAVAVAVNGSQPGRAVVGATLEAIGARLPVQKITYAQLIERLSNPGAGKEDLAAYFIHDKNQSGAYAPAMRVNPETVEMGEAPETVQNFMKPANHLCAFYRQSACRERLAQGYEGLRFVSEGDSWFEYPFILDDVVDQLGRDYAIFCVAAAGDELKNMASVENLNSQIYPALKESKADGLLFSGGGNDIVGEVLLRCLAENKGQAKPYDYLTPEFDAQLRTIEGHYIAAFDAILSRYPALKIFTHGYDLSKPAAGGQWLGSFFETQKILDGGLQRDIIKLMLSKVTGMHAGLQNRYRGRVFFVDCAGVVGESAWYDELHPNNTGFKRVADRFRESIAHAFPGGRRQFY